MGQMSLWGVKVPQIYNINIIIIIINIILLILLTYIKSINIKEWKEFRFNKSSFLEKFMIMNYYKQIYYKLFIIQLIIKTIYFINPLGFLDKLKNIKFSRLKSKYRIGPHNKIILDIMFGTLLGNGHLERRFTLERENSSYRW